MCNSAGTYAYWEGDDRHWFYELCWQTVKRWNPAAILLSRRDVEDLLGEIPRELDEICVVHRTDWVRKAVIARVGGLWLDMDFICWTDLSPLARASPLFDFIGWKELHGTGWMDNFFAARRGSPIEVEAAAHALAEVRRQGKDLGWLSTNADTMNYVIARHAQDRWIEIPPHLIGPVSVVSSDWFTAEEDNVDEEIAAFRSLGFMTSWQNLQYWLKGIPGPHALLAGRWRLSAMLRRGLGITGG
jgi:hypothetical protein